MTFNPSLQASDVPSFDEENDIVCVRCNSSAALTLESIGPVSPRMDGWVTVEYSCGKCDTFYAHAAPVVSVAKILAMSNTPTGVLQFGRYFIHCGEPMEKTTIQPSRLRVDDSDLAAVPTVQVPTAVLRCHCGFQMAIPQ
jgi:hypothetical protein